MSIRLENGGGILVTLANLLDDHQPEKASIIIPNGPTVSYGEFGNEVERVAGLLAASGLEKGRAVSIVLGNGLDFMVIFLAVTRSGAIAAPLNSAYTVEEFKFYRRRGPIRTLRYGRTG